MLTEQGPHRELDDLAKQLVDGDWGWSEVR